MDGQPQLSWVKACPFAMIETFQSMPFSSIVRISEGSPSSIGQGDSTSKTRVVITSTKQGK